MRGRRALSVVAGRSPAPTGAGLPESSKPRDGNAGGGVVGAVGVGGVRSKPSDGIASTGDGCDAAETLGACADAAAGAGAAMGGGSVTPA